MRLTHLADAFPEGRSLDDLEADAELFLADRDRIVELTNENDLAAVSPGQRLLSRTSAECPMRAHR
jgi:hypothetical protein